MSDDDGSTARDGAPVLSDDSGLPRGGGGGADGGGGGGGPPPQNPPIVPENLAALAAERKRLYSAVENILARVDGAAPAQMAFFKPSMERLERVQGQFDDCQKQICMANVRFPATQRLEVERVQKKFDDLVHTAQNLFMRHTTKGTSPARSGGPKGNIRKPKIDIPKFNGDIKNWSHFYHVFDVTVHKDPDLTNVERLVYLKAAVEEEPLSLIVGLDLIPENYTAAWNILFQRYNNERRHVTHHFNGLIDLPDVTNNAGLPAFHAKLQEHTQALTALKIKLENYGPLLTAMVLRKLPVFLKRRFEDRRTDNTKYPSISELEKFLRIECVRLDDESPKGATSSSKSSRRDAKVLHVAQADQPAANSSSNPKKVRGKRHAGPSKQAQPPANPSYANHPTPRPESSHSGVRDKNCRWCNKNHVIFKCEAFLQMTPEARWTAVKDRDRCFNCIGEHKASACPSNKRCGETVGDRACGAKHHSLLHPCAKPFEDSGQTSGAPQIPPALVSRETLSAQTSTVVLPTAQVLLTSLSGHKVRARALIDTAAQVSILTSRCASGLRLQPTDPAHVSGLSHNSVPISGSVVVTLRTKDGALVKSDHNFKVVDTITDPLPSVVVDPKFRALIASYPLADSLFDVPGPVECLIGADLYSDVMTGPNKVLGPSLPVAAGTVFGYVIIGPAPTCSKSAPGPAAVHPVTLLVNSLDLNRQVENFWRIEEPAPPTKLSPEEIAAENFYAETVKQLENGHYQVRLPFREGHAPLGASRARAEQRFKSLERRFRADPTYRQLYTEFMNEYLNNGYMKPVPDPPRDSQHYYLPHHGVAKQSSSTTKLRVVFDASALTTNQNSLNDILLPGPKLQSEIPEVLLNFRRYKVPFSGDIRQMFLQIELHASDHRYQLILWRPSEDKPLQTYALTTVTFGICSSPYLAIRTLKQLALDHGHKFPDASEILLNELYVDDCASGGFTEEHAAQRMRDLIALLALGGFQMRKWISTHSSLLQLVPTEHLEVPNLEDPENPRFSIVGLKWIPSQDVFTYSIQPAPHSVTKRGILSLIASIFDPIGWLAPVIFRAKSFMQRLWLIKLSWDTPLPANVVKEWRSFVESLPALNQVQIPRHLSAGGQQIQVHAYCDASERGYGVVLYTRTAPLAPVDTAEVALIAAKTRVAPLKPLTLPRLELCGAALLAAVLEYYVPKLQAMFQIERIHAWSDSTVVLSWIQTPAYRLKTFVANRVAAIQDLKMDVVWSHVKSEDNPADIASRGLPAEELAQCKLWWYGPEWLSLPAEKWPKLPPPLLEAEKVPELKPTTQVLVATKPRTELPMGGTWEKTIRSYAWMLRLAAWKFEKRLVKGRLTSSELASVEAGLIRHVQRTSLRDERCRVQNGKPCPKPIQRLCPFMDAKGILRVGGRIQKSTLSETAKHPALLPASHPFTRLLVKRYHESYLHAGPQLLESLLAQRYWILRVRNLARSCVHNCLKCFRAKPKGDAPLMGNLPEARVQQHLPFIHSGMDFAGPFTVRVHQLRSARAVQVYLAIFICLSTKAVHIEVVHDLTSTAFIASLQRLAARRGLPAHLYCDCGRNFVGAANEFKRLLQQRDDELDRYAVENHISFHFNPPAAPWQGGIWEAAVKSAKYHLKRTMGAAVLILEEFRTLTIRIEAMLNSRPLTPLSSDPNDLRPLTPGHFLIGRALVSPPEAEADVDRLPSLRRWKLVEGMFQAIWKRWQLEYIHTLQPRGKWSKDVPTLKVDSLVLIHEPNSPPLYWRLGRVTQVFPGEDNRVRVAQVRTATGELRRPVQKLYPLPL